MSQFKPESAPDPGRVAFILHFVALFVLFAGLFEANADLGFAITLLVGSLYAVWSVRIVRRRIAGPVSTWRWVPAFLGAVLVTLLQSQVGWGIVLTIHLLLGWAMLATVWSGEVFSIASGGAVAALAALVFSCLLLIPLALLGAALLGRGPGERVADSLRAVRRRWGTAVLTQLLLSLPLGAAAFSITLTFLARSTIGRLLELSSNGEEGLLLTAATTYPVLFVPIIAAATMLPLHRHLVIDAGGRLASMASAETQMSDRMPGLNGNAARALAAAGTLLAIAASLAFIHTGLVAALTTVPVIAPVFKTMNALDAEIADMEGSGRSVPAILARLDAKKLWTSAAPDSGLPELSPDLHAALDGLGKDVMCDFRLAAGPMTSRDRVSIGAASRTSRTSVSSVKYCLKVTCTTSLLDSHPVRSVLVTSHGGANRGWSSGRVASDLLTITGGIGSSGGFCMPDGELAAEFQG